MDRAEAEAHAKAVLSVVREAVDAAAFHALVTQLPDRQAELTGYQPVS